MKRREKDRERDTIPVENPLTKAPLERAHLATTPSYYALISPTKKRKKKEKRLTYIK